MTSEDLPSIGKYQLLRKLATGGIVNKELGREEDRLIDVPAKGLVVRHSFGE